MTQPELRIMRRAVYTDGIPYPTGVPGECATVGEIEELLRGMSWRIQ